MREASRMNKSGLSRPQASWNVLHSQNRPSSEDELFHCLTSYSFPFKFWHSAFCIIMQIPAGQSLRAKEFLLTVVSPHESGWPSWCLPLSSPHHVVYLMLYGSIM
jgi:hypothetical protein